MISKFFLKYLFNIKKICLFVCCCPVDTGSYLILIINKIKYITLVGAPLAPKKETIAGIGEIISPILSATYPASHALSFFLFTFPNFFYISNIKSFIICIPLLSFLIF